MNNESNLFIDPINDGCYSLIKYVYYLNVVLIHAVGTYIGFNTSLVNFVF